MEVRQLRYLVAVHLSGSMSRAADELYVSQPAVSRQIAELERECGIALFDRTPTGVVATSAGVAMFRQARAVLQLVDSSVDVVRAVGPVTETVELGLAPGLPSDWIAGFITRVGDDLPGASLALMDATSSEQFRLLRAGRLDIAIAHQRPPTDLAGRLLRTEPFGVSLAPGKPWEGRTSMRVADLDGMDVLAHARDQVSAAHDHLVAATELSGARPRWHFLAYTENASACALATGATASVQTRTSAKRLLPDWRWVPLIDPTVEMETWIVKQPTNRAVVEAMFRSVSAFAHAAPE